MPLKVEFQDGQPVLLHLQHAQGLEVASKYYERWPGDTTQYVFSAEEGVFYLSDSAGRLLNARLRSLGVAAGEEITITRVKVPSPHTARPVTEYVPAQPGKGCIVDTTEANRGNAYQFLAAKKPTKR